MVLSVAKLQLLMNRKDGLGDCSVVAAQYFSASGSCVSTVSKLFVTGRSTVYNRVTEVFPALTGQPFNVHLCVPPEFGVSF